MILFLFSRAFFLFSKDNYKSFTFAKEKTMIVYLFCGMLVFLPFIHLNVVSSEQIVKISKEVELIPNLHQILNNTKLITSEGGPLLSNTTVTLPKENHSVILNFDTESLKNKTKSVVPRKGVKYDIEELNSMEQDLLSSTDMNTLDDRSNSAKVPKPILYKSEIKTKEKKNETKVHKPTVLSSQLLDELGDKIKMQPEARLKKMHENSHPDLVMPIVITILVVPMFAVVGYIAIKRGQEAWKNRHYKRMDFLLDGMYNE